MFTDLSDDSAVLRWKAKINVKLIHEAQRMRYDTSYISSIRRLAKQSPRHVHPAGGVKEIPSPDGA